MRLPTILLVLLLLAAPLAGCLGGDGGECSDRPVLLEFVEVNSGQFFNEFSMPVYPPQSEGPANLSEVTEGGEWVWSEVTEVGE